jgi:hypothetical protein
MRPERSSEARLYFPETCFAASSESSLVLRTSGVVAGHRCHPILIDSSILLSAELRIFARLRCDQTLGCRAAFIRFTEFVCSCLMIALLKVDFGDEI